jgi:hypothetical protein
MYGVIVQMRIDRGHDDEVRAMVEAEVVPRAWQLPGFAGGSWFQALDGDGGTAVMFFDSEETARGFADRVASRGPLVHAPVWALEGVGTYEVLARA